MKKIPVTILSGFLGSGKTTFLNRLLSNYSTLKIQVIENEFGNENIDGKLLENTDRITEISNGCICCSSESEFTSTLFDLIDKKNLPDHILIETTGIADPESIIKMFLFDYSLHQYFDLNAVITLVDSLHVDELLPIRPEISKQIKNANLIAITKSDIASKYQLDTALNICSNLQPDAPVYYLPNDFNSVDWLNVGAFSIENVFQELTLFSKSAVQQKHDKIQKILLELEIPLDILKFDTWIKSILQFPGFRIHRIKGFLQLDDLPDKIVLQSVQTLYQTSSGGKWNKDETKKSKLVLIGENLPFEKIKKSFELTQLNEAYIDYSEYCEQLEKIFES